MSRANGLKKGYWKTADGEIVAYKDLKTEHLKNILKFIEKKAKKGLILTYGYRDDKGIIIWYKQEILYNTDVFEYFDYYDLKKELERRCK